MASNEPEPVQRGDVPTTVILSSVIALLLALVIGAGTLAGRPEETLSVALTEMPRRAAEAATVEAASKGVVVSVNTATPRAQGTPAPEPPTPSGPPAEPGAGNAANGRRLFASLACNSCHAIPGVSEAATCPPLANIGNIAATRKPGYTAGQYLVESITNPNAFVVPNFQPNVMPKTYATLPQAQINDLVAYLEAQKR